MWLPRDLLRPLHRQPEASGSPLDVGRMTYGIYGIHPMRDFQADREDCR
jgi:hypothetical protein